MIVKIKIVLLGRKYLCCVLDNYVYHPSCIPKPIVPVDFFSSQQGLYDLGPLDVPNLSGLYDVSVHDDQIGLLAHTQRPRRLLLPHGIGAVDRVSLNGRLKECTNIKVRKLEKRCT